MGFKARMRSVVFAHTSGHTYAMGAFALSLLLAFAEPTSCAVPNAPARAVNLFPPETPFVWQSDGLSGTVEIIVALDEESKMVKTEVFLSSNRLLTNAAVAAARRSTFQTQIVNCKPRTAAFIYVVRYSTGSRPAFENPTLLDPTRYLRGSWSCTAAGVSPTLERFDVDSTAERLVHTSGATTETITREQNGTWHLTTDDGARDQTAPPWTIGWWFKSTRPDRPFTTNYARIDDVTFRRLTDEPGAAGYRLDTCKKSPQPSS